MMENLTTKGKLQLIRTLVKNKNVPDINEDFICQHYNDEHLVLEGLSVMIYKLMGITLVEDCNCDNYLAEHWPENLIEGYARRCRRRR
jgi:hypothetical protein